MKKNISKVLLGMIVIAVLAACQAIGANPGNAPVGSGAGATNGNSFTNQGQGGGFNGTPRARGTGFNGTPRAGGFSGNGGNGGNGFQSTRTPAKAQPTATAVPTAVPTATTDNAVKTVQAYFDALQKQDFTAASKQISSFSLLIAQMTNGDAADALKAQAAQWSGLQVKDAQTFDDNTVLVHVLYQLTTKDAKTGKDTVTPMDELWPVRLEVGKWLYNWNNIIDFHTLDVQQQSTAGLLIMPLQLIRYSDHIALKMLVQNSTNEPIVLGQTNEVMAAFHFGDKVVEGDQSTRLIFDSLRSYPNTIINVKGLFTSYPDSVVIRQWKNVKVAPWFTFQFGA